MEDDLDLFSAFDDGKTLSKEEASKIASSASKIKSNQEKNVEISKPSTTSLKRKEITNLNELPKSKEPKIIENESTQIVNNTLKSENSSQVCATGTQQKNVISFSAYPPDYTKPSPIPIDQRKPPAKEYPFKLDPFQQQSVDYIEMGESVLVSAHTSAGKTAVAEYAIAKSLRDKQRVIYTSPIKALSNQKYRDLQEEFEDVGLMTGDITINPTATCLIMTTEILRSMLYRGSEIMREVAWVIYDEIHYMRDKERGVVWEESIILLPHKVRFVFLSATIPNSREFAKWICSIHHQPCHVVYTDYRPTPLQHYVFPAGGDGLHLVVDEKGKFCEDNFQAAMTILSAQGQNEMDGLNSMNSNKKKQKRFKKNTGSDVFRIVRLIMEREYDPVIIFSFSKRECEAYAQQMSKLDFNGQDEKEMVEQVFRNAMDSLSDDDKKLPQVDSILPLLKRGIGIHHGGLLPILKEVIEIMFGEGLLKCLFATETFSMGLNMPAKTVVFTNCRKYDGKDFRWIRSGEYIQMSGRAGRRSLDSRGIVIQMLTEQMEPQVAKGILYGQADPLHSTFHLGYNMLLNLLRVEDADPEYMIKQSFHQFQNEQSAPGLQEELNRLEEEQKHLLIEKEDEVAEYYHIGKQITKLRSTMRLIMNKPSISIPFLNPGRLIRINDGKMEWEWGVVVNFQKKDDLSAIVHVLLNCIPNKSTDEAAKPAPKDSLGTSNGEMKVCPVMTSLIDGLSTIRVYIPKDLSEYDNRQAVGKSLREVLRRFPDGIPFLDPLKDLKIDDESFNECIEKTSLLETKLSKHSFHICKDKDSRYAMYHNKMENEAKIRHLQREIKNTQNLVLKEDLRHRKRVLRRLGLTSSQNVIERKGRTACEISTADELLVTELIFTGVFNELEVNECVALLSCLVNTEKQKEGQGPPSIPDKLETPMRQLKETASRIANVYQESKVMIEIEEYVNSFNPSMIEAIMAWCQGAKFAQVLKLADTFEGTIIRIIRRLEELLRQMTVAAHAMGNVELEKKFSEGCSKIKRDIVFAASLYL